MTLLQRGTITLVFDDGYESILRTVVPILDEAKIPGVFGIALNEENIANSERHPVASWSEWIKLRDRGHEIAAHSMTHVNLTTLSADQLSAELSEPHDKLSANTLIYPGGAFNDNVIIEARKYYKAARTVKHGIENIPPADPMRLKTINFTKRNFSVCRANLWAIWAWLTNAWLIETYHLVGDVDNSVMHNVSLTGFTSHIKFLRKLPVRIQTISDVIK